MAGAAGSFRGSAPPGRRAARPVGTHRRPKVTEARAHGTRFLVRGDVYYWGSLMAGCLIASLPIAILYNLFLDRFIAGFTVGAVK